MAVVQHGFVCYQGFGLPIESTDAPVSVYTESPKTSVTSRYTLHSIPGE
jgi:hypothetical protein